MNNLELDRHVSLVELADELGALSTDDLRRELASALSVTARTLTRLALIVRILEERGEDLESLRIGLLHHLRLIASNQLLPEVVVRFACEPRLIAKIGHLPIPDQRRLADGESLPLAVVEPAGDKTHLMVDILNCEPRQWTQLLAPDHIRTIAEQVVWINNKQAVARKAIPDRIGELKLDRQRGGVMVGKKFITLADLVAAVAALRR